MKNVPTNSSNWKSKVDRLDVDKLVPVPVDLGKLSDVVKNDVFEKDVYNAKIKNIEDKISDVTNLATKTTLNANTNEVKGEISSITKLATTGSFKAKINEVKVTTTALTAAEIKILNVSNLLKKSDYNIKDNKIFKKLLIMIMINILLLQVIINKLIAEHFTVKLAQANLASKKDIAALVKKIDFH